MSAETIVHIVDDDSAMRDSLAFLLSAAGFDVKLHESAIQFLGSGAKPEGCVVTDIRMPEMDGLELLRRLKASSPQLPVIVMTGHGDVPLAVEAMKLGAADFVEKPFDDEVLLGAIKSAIEQKRRHAVAGEVDPDIASRAASYSPGFAFARTAVSCDMPAPESTTPADTRIGTDCPKMPTKFSLR